MTMREERVERGRRGARGEERESAKIHLFLFFSNVAMYGSNFYHPK